MNTPVTSHQTTLSSTESLLTIKQLQSWHLDPDQLANGNISGQEIPAVRDSRNVYIGRMLIVLKNELRYLGHRSEYEINRVSGQYPLIIDRTKTKKKKQRLIVNNSTYLINCVSF